MIRLGYNGDKQTNLDQVPSNILIEGIDVLAYRGKRFIEINSTKTDINSISILDAYSPVGQDSQAINILNTPGDINISNFHLQAASNNIMIGGDRPWIPGNHIKNVIVRNGILDKPLEWKLANTPKVKNLLEIKDGWYIIISDVICRNCWVSGQTGYCFMLTPSRGSLRDINIINCDVSNVGGIINITGTDAHDMFKERTTVKVDSGTYITNKSDMGGTGWFALLTRGPESFEVYNSNIEVDGNAFLVIGDSSPVDKVIIKGNEFNHSKYGININGQMYGNNPYKIVKELVVEDNIIHGANSTFKKNFPSNKYVA